MQAASLKAEANKAFAAKQYLEATKLYSDAIAVDPTNHVLFSNRSASKLGQRDYDGALEDAEKVWKRAMLYADGRPSRYYLHSARVTYARVPPCMVSVSTQRLSWRTRPASRSSRHPSR
jgi:tetratricopeptide (TPR) repeat protein